MYENDIQRICMILEFSDNVVSPIIKKKITDHINDRSKILNMSFVIDLHNFAKAERLNGLAVRVYLDGLYRIMVERGKNHDPNIIPTLGI